MKLIDRFKRFPVLYFIIALVALATIYVCAFFLPDAYIDFIPAKMVPLIVFTAICFAYLAVLIGDVKGRKTKFIIIESVIIGVVGGLIFPFYQVVFNILLKINFNLVMILAQATDLVLASVIAVYLFILVGNYFDLKKKLKSILAIFLLAVTFSVCVLPSCSEFFKDYFRKYSFLTEPSVFVNDTGYSIIFATSMEGTGVVTVVKDGVETVYREEKNGVEKFDSMVHRVDVPKEALDNADYYLSSQKSFDVATYKYNMGKTITSDRYSFKPYSGDGDVSFLAVSDNQGTPEPTWKAVSSAYEKYDYDFVFMLGDHAEAYNDVEKDVVNSLLKVSGLASRGEKPVYYTLGNHEYRGMLASWVMDLIPTPSTNGEFYYTFTVGDAYFTVLNYGVDHDDDYTAKYTGIVHNNDYRDKEYDWYVSTMEAKPYESYRYNAIISHIPAIVEYGKNDGKRSGQIVPAYDFICKECNKTHDYKWREFIDTFNANNVGCVISGHTHLDPADYKVDGCDFMQINTGSYYAGKTQFKNVIVTFEDGEYKYTVYSSED